LNPTITPIYRTRNGKEFLTHEAAEKYLLKIAMDKIVQDVSEKFGREFRRILAETDTPA